MNFKQAGISLVETLVGLSIAAGISVVLMRQQETSSKMQTKNNANQVIASAVNVIQTALSNRASCSLTLVGKGVGDSVTQILEGKVNPLDFTNNIATGKIIADYTTILPGDVKVDSMVIISDGGAEFLKVVFNSDPKGTKKMIGSSVTAKNFKLQGEIVAGKFTKCYSENSNLVQSAVQEACLSIGGAWNGTNCTQASRPIYQNTLNGSLSATAYDMIQSGTYTCSNCGGGCNACPAGWTMSNQGCPLGGQCGFRRWRNCSMTCSISRGQTPVYGRLIINVP
jgi:type II secretory pathway pseudopilin PulG